MAGLNGTAPIVEPAEIMMISADVVLPGGDDESINESLLKEQAGDSIGRYIQGALFGYYRDARRNEQEDICLAAERAYHNKYDLATQRELAQRKEESGDCTVWIPYTRTKVNIAVAKTYEKILTTNDNLWSIVPEQIDQREIDQNKAYIDMALMQGILQEDPKTAIEKLQEFSENEKREKCDSMEMEIADQLNQGKAEQSCAKTILQQHYLGTGIGKFEIEVKDEQRWIEGPLGWELSKVEKPFPKVKFVNWFNAFFDPYANENDGNNGVIERHVKKRSYLLSLKESQGFDQDVIRKIILENPTGNHIDMDYETTIKGINNQDQNLQSGDDYYDIYEAWIELSGDKLIEYGYDSDDIVRTNSYATNCWVCANYTIKLIMNPHKPQRTPYFVVPYEENTSNLNGTGICEDLFGIQDVINSATRAAVDNGAFSHAPITELNVDLLKSGETVPRSIKPRSIMLREGGDPKEPMLRFYNIPENSNVLFNLYNLFSQLGEDATGIAGSSEESLPAANTANLSVSMGMTQKNILQRSVVGNIDKYLYKPMIEMFYNFNMQWNDRDDIKAPAKVKANGVTSIIAKEMRAQQLTQFAQLTSSPADAAIVDRKEVFEELATSLDQDGEKFVYSDRKVKENQKRQQEQQMQAAKAEQQGILSQINAENQGELEQARVKGSQDYRKQQLVENSKLTQIAAKDDMEITDYERELLQQLRNNEAEMQERRARVLQQAQVQQQQQQMRV